MDKGGTMKNAVGTIGQAVDGLAAGAATAGIITVVVIGIVAATGRSRSLPGFVEATAQHDGGGWAMSVDVGFQGILCLAAAGMTLRLVLSSRRAKQTH